MIEEEKNEIVGKLENEGQLLRNKGTNSIKSVNVRLDKFATVFNSIDNSLMLQSVLLQESLNLSNEEMEMKRRQALIAQEEAETRQRQEDLGGDKKDKDKPKPETNNNSIRGKMENAFQSMFGFLGTSAASAALNVAKGAALLALAPAIGSFVGDFVKAMLTDIIDGDGLPLSEAQADFVENFGSALSTGVTWGALGLIFGKKFAAAMFAVTAIADYFNLDDAAKDFLTNLGMDETFAEAAVQIALGVASGVVMLAVPFIVKRTLAGVGLALGTYAMPALKGAASTIGSAIASGMSSLGSVLSKAASGIISRVFSVGFLSKFLRFAGPAGAVVAGLGITELGDGTLDSEIAAIQDDPTLKQDEKNAKIEALFAEREKRFAAGQLREEIASRPIDAFNTRDYPYASNYSRPETMITGGLTTNGVVMGGSDQERMQDRIQNTVLPIIEKIEKQSNVVSTNVDLSNAANLAEGSIMSVVRIGARQVEDSSLRITENFKETSDRLLDLGKVMDSVKVSQMDFVEKSSIQGQTQTNIVFAPQNNVSTVNNGGSYTNMSAVNNLGFQSLDMGLPKSAN